MSPMRFLITGARAPVALEWVRRLGRAGHTVAAADSFEHSICRNSRYLERYYRLPAARADPARFAEAVMATAVEFGASLVIPTCEEIFHLAGSGLFDRGPVRLFADPISQLRLLHDKGTFAEFTKTLRHAIQAPESHVVQSPLELRRFEIGAANWVLKPVYSRFGSRTVLRGSPENWRAIRLSASEPWLVQQRVTGIEYCTYAIAVGGRLMAFAAYHSRHRTRNIRGEPGAGIYFEPVEMPGLLDFTRAVAAALPFTGQIAFDFIVDPERTWVLECNPRATSGLHLLRSRDPIPCLTGTADGLWIADPAPRMLAPAMLLSPKKWFCLRDLARARDVIYASDDPQPFFHSWRFVRELKTRARVLGMSLQEASTADIEWNGEMMERHEPRATAEMVSPK